MVFTSISSPAGALEGGAAGHDGRLPASRLPPPGNAERGCDRDGNRRTNRGWEREGAVVHMHSIRGLWRPVLRRLLTTVILLSAVAPTIAMAGQCDYTIRVLEPASDVTYTDTFRYRVCAPDSVDYFARAWVLELPDCITEDDIDVSASSPFVFRDPDDVAGLRGSGSLRASPKANALIIPSS